MDSNQQKFHHLEKLTAQFTGSNKTCRSRFNRISEDLV